VAHTTHKTQTQLSPTESLSRQHRCCDPRFTQTPASSLPGTPTEPPAYSARRSSGASCPPVGTSGEGGGDFVCRPKHEARFVSCQSFEPANALRQCRREPCALLLCHPPWNPSCVSRRPTSATRTQLRTRLMQQDSACAIVCAGQRLRRNHSGILCGRNDENRTARLRGHARDTLEPLSPNAAPTDLSSALLQRATRMTWRFTGSRASSLPGTPAEPPA
jgi:hypothetical protein